MRYELKLIHGGRWKSFNYITDFKDPFQFLSNFGPSIKSLHIGPVNWTLKSESLFEIDPNRENKVIYTYVNLTIGPEFLFYL